MITMYVTYAGNADTPFDREHWINVHFPLVRECWGPYGLERLAGFFLRRRRRPDRNRDLCLSRRGSHGSGVGLAGNGASDGRRRSCHRHQAAAQLGDLAQRRQHDSREFSEGLEIWILADPMSPRRGTSMSSSAVR